MLGTRVAVGCLQTCSRADHVALAASTFGINRLPKLAILSSKTGKLLVLVSLLNSLSEVFFLRTPGPCADASFTRVRNGAFVDENCTEFTFSGYNTWEVCSRPMLLFVLGALSYPPPLHSQAHPSVVTLAQSPKPVRNMYFSAYTSLC